MIDKYAAASYRTLAIDSSRDWLTIWLNRPESRNALSGKMVDELFALFELLASDSDIRGITLRGKGGIFCAGGDIKAFKQLASGEVPDVDTVINDNLQGGRLFDRLNTLPQVVVALVEGAAMAGGLGMVCCADVVAVTSDAQFAITETTLGIPPAQIAPFVVDRLGLRMARRLMLTAARFTGVDALQIGLADFVADDIAALDEIDARIRKDVRRCAPGANAATKELLLKSRRLDPESMREFAARTFAGCMLSDEGREGINAFVEKRKPAWTQP